MEVKELTLNKGKENEFSVEIRKPTNKQLLESEKAYKKAFRVALEDGAMLRKKLGAYMEEQSIWTEKNNEEYENILKEINILDYQLNKGKDIDGNKLKISQAKEMALELSDKRVEFRDLIGERQDLDHMTAEGQAETERFSRLIYLCTYDSLTKKPYFPSYEVFQEKGNTQEVVEISSAAGEVLFGVDPDYDNSLTENKFLKRFKFIDEKNHLINTEGKRVDREGTLVDEEGFLLNDENQRVNINDLPILNEEEDVEKVDFEDDLGVIKNGDKKTPTRKRKIKKEDKTE